MCYFPPFLGTFLSLKGNRATSALAVGNALRVTGITQTEAAHKAVSTFADKVAGAGAASGKRSRFSSLKRRFPPLVPHRLRTTGSQSSPNGA